MLVKQFRMAMLALGIFAFSSVNAQDAPGAVAMETQFNIFQDSAYTPNLKLRYFFADQGALRLTLGYNYSSVANEIHETNGDGVGTLEDLTSAFNMGIGYEKHFAHEKFTSYVGGELLFGVGKLEQYGSRTDSITFVPDYNYSIKRPTSSIGVGLFTGVDVNVFDGFYIGTEIGVNFMKHSIKRGEFKAEDGSSTTASEVTESIPAVTTKNFSVVNAGVIRVGWRF